MSTTTGKNNHPCNFMICPCGMHAKPHIYSLLSPLSYTSMLAPCMNHSTDTCDNMYDLRSCASLLCVINPYTTATSNWRCWLFARYAMMSCQHQVKALKIMSHKYCTSSVIHYNRGITCHQLCSICRHVCAQSLQKVLPSCPLYTYLYMYLVALLLATTSLSQQQHLHCFAEQSMPCQSSEAHQ